MKEIVIDIETTGLEPQSSQLICIVARDPQLGRTYSFQNEDEKEMIENFLLFFDKRDYDSIIGYNILFDIRYIFAKACKHQIDGKGFFNTKYEDLMAIMKSVGYRYSTNNAGSLDDWAEMMFGEQKLMENDEVPEKYQQGDIQEIVEYCEKDVELTEKLWKRIKSVIEKPQQLHQ